MNSSKLLLALTPSEISHMIVEGIFALFLIFVAVLLVFNTRHIYALLKHGEDDRRAREEALIALRKEAADLAAKTAEATRVHQQYLRGLEEKIDHNTAMTREAAEASGKAERAANHVNDKIADTNARLLEQTTKRADKIDTIIEEAAEVGLDTNKKVTVVEKTLVEREKEG